MTSLINQKDRHGTNYIEIEHTGKNVSVILITVIKREIRTGSEM